MSDTPTRFKALYDFIGKHVHDVVNEQVAQCLLDNGAESTTARTLLRHRDRLKFQIAQRIMDHSALAELSSIMRKTKK